MTEEEKMFWMAAYLTRLHRGDITTDCANLADKAVQDYREAVQDADLYQGMPDGD